MENDDSMRTQDLPDDLTPFITRTTLDPVGGGGFGDVWKCNYNHDTNGLPALVAVKAFKLPDRYDLETINGKINQKIGILKILRHNNIVPLWGIATGFGRMPELPCFVSSWMPNGTLNAYLAFNHNDLTALDRSRILEDVSAGLRYLHSIYVVHGDITGSNILIDKGGHARLIDFGLSTITNALLGQSHLAAISIRPGAIRYAAPELVLPDNALELPVRSYNADIYSFGCVMLQVLSGRRPWSEILVEPFIIITMSRGRGPQRPNGHPAIIDSDWKFIQKCLQSKPELRPSADDVLDSVMHRFSSPGLPDSNEISESSTTPEPEGHSLGEIFLCKWNVPWNIFCDASIHGYDLSSHLREVHGIRGSNKIFILCHWNGCNKKLQKESFLRHVEEIHLRIKYSCECGKTFSRRDTLHSHMRRCSSL